MTKKHITRYWPVSILLLIMALLATACGGPAAAPGTPTAPEQPAQDATPDPISTQMGPPMENSLRIAEPLPGTVLTNTVTVRGEGRAFENTILVEVTAGGQVLGKEIVTTAAEMGQVGEFTTTVKLTPVAAPTDGILTIYTESAKDGSIDQKASVPVKLVPLDTPAGAISEAGNEQQETALQVGQDFVSVWIEDDEKAALNYLDGKIRQTVESGSDVQANIARLMGVQNIPQSSSFETIKSDADLTIVRVTLQFVEGASQADLALKQKEGKWLITGIKAVAYAP